MSVTVTVNNTNYTIPETNETGWGANVTSWIQGVSSSTLQKSGGTFTLSADVDFGSAFGLKSIYLKSRATSPATTGVIRLGNAEVVAWRNVANSANLSLTTDGSDRLTFGGTVVDLATDTIGVARGGTNVTSYTAGDLLYASGTTTLSKLAIGSTGQVLKVSASLPSWGSAASSLAVTSKTGTYSILNTDDLILCDSSGGAFTLTLPDCATNSGKVFIIKKTDSVFATANAITIARAGSDVIQDASSTVTSTTLNTQGEEIQIVSGGSTTWQILSRRIPCQWIAFTPTGSWSTNTTYTGFWRRNGDSIEVQSNLALAGAPTSASLTVNMPSGITTNNSKLVQTSGAGVHSVSMELGEAIAYDSSADDSFPLVIGYESTSSIHVWVQDADVTPLYVRTVSQSAPMVFATGDYVSLRYSVPITGWNG